MTSFFETLETSTKDVKFRTEGTCRVKGCVVYYDRTSGRNGMCNHHYKICLKEVGKEGKERTTWEEINDRYPEKAFTQPEYDTFSETLFRETEFQNALVRLIQSLGHRSWVLDAPKGAKGVPDLLIITKDSRVMFRELKCDAGLSKIQMKMIEAMQDAGLDVGVWTPDDLSSHRIEGELSGAQKRR